MSLDQLRYFVTVAEAGTTRAAAAQLHISQPPLSRQIRALEDEIGVDLFTRSHRGMQLLPAGRVFLSHARHILGAVESAVSAAREPSCEAHPWPSSVARAVPPEADNPPS